MREHDIALALEAMTLGCVAAGHVEHVTGDDAAAMQQHQAVYGTNELRLARPPAHQLGNGKLLQRVCQQSGKVRFERRSEEHTSELQSQSNLVCRLLLEKKKHN